ncbi:MAG TPA: hypothetical protein VM050_07115 [Patescibacteria group bacterium]|nr:hypothetical protein [Patescibacteria group bacterium]
MSLGKLRERIREEVARYLSPSTIRALPGDVVEFCRGLLGCARAVRDRFSLHP